MQDSVNVDSLREGFDIAHGHSVPFTRARAAVEETLDGMKEAGILSSYEGKPLVERSGCMERVYYKLNCLEFSRAEAKKRSYRVRAAYRLYLDLNTGDQLRLVLKPCGTQARIMLNDGPKDLEHFVARLTRGERFDAFDQGVGALMLPALNVVMADITERFQAAHARVSSLSRVFSADPGTP